MAEVPHFAIPFRFVGAPARAAEVEQDTLDDIAVCVEAIVRTRPGDRMENTRFGIEDPTFGINVSEGEGHPHSVDTMMAEIETWEPRAAIAVSEGWDFPQFIKTLAVEVREGFVSG